LEKIFHRRSPSFMLPIMSLSTRRNETNRAAVSDASHA
jgi:hypothetical protein